LDYADQRYYDKASGRFLTADPYTASSGPGNPTSWNRYSYVLGDPVNWRDPRGLYEQCPAGTHTGPDGKSCVLDPYMPSFGGGGGGGHSSPHEAQLMIPPDYELQPQGGSLDHTAATNHIFGSPFARRLLQSEDCAKAVGAPNSKHAVGEFDKLRFRFSDLGSHRAQLNSDGSINAITPAPLGSQNGNLITINSRTDWLNPDRTIAEVEGGGSIVVALASALATLLKVESLSGGEFNALVILHEIKHYLGAPQEPAGGYEYNRAIIRNCMPHLSLYE